MMKIRVLLLLMILSSCEKEAYISIPDEANKPVLNLLMNKDSVMMARLTLSSRLAPPWQLPEMENAIVYMFENDVFKEMLTPVERIGGTYYMSTTVPRVGATYRIHAAASGYPTIMGSDYIPDTVRVGELKMSITQTGDDTRKMSISVQLHDDPAIQNYYRIRIYQINEYVDANGNGHRQKLLQYFESEDGGLPIFNNDVQSEFYTTDALFNGRSPKFVFRANSYSDVQKMVVQITSLTPSSYNYLNSVYMAQWKNEDGLSEKVIVYNNIINGLGIVGGVAQREYEITQ
jgi:hypothetical protein